MDVITMGHILHDWNLQEKKMLVKKAYEALNPGGALVVYDAIIDDDRSKNAFGLMMSLNMLIETAGGLTTPVADCIAWMKEAGFKDAMWSIWRGRIRWWLDSSNPDSAAFCVQDLR